MECPNCGRHIHSFTKNCPTCGKPIPPAQYLLEESGVVPASSPVVTTTSDSAYALRPTARLATLGDRLVASAIDAVVLLALFAVVDVWAFLRWNTAAPAGWDLTAASLLMAALLDIAVCFLYCWLFEAAFGGTLGKLMVGIRVIPAGVRGMLAASAIRNALRAIDAIGFYLVGVLVACCTRMRQRIGDVVAGTAVIEQEVGRWGKVLATFSWAAILAACAWALPRVCAREFAAQPPRYLARVSAQMGWTNRSAYVRFHRLRVDVQLAPITSRSEVAGRADLKRAAQ